MFTKFKTTLFLILAVVFSPAAIAAANPYQSMQVISDTVFSEIKAQTAQIKADPDRLKAIVRKDVMGYVQVKYAAALILGNYYKSASQPQRDAYFAAFDDFLVQAFAQALSMYNGQDYQVEKEKSFENKNMLSVRVLLIPVDRVQQPIKFDFQWRKNSVTGEWLMYDLVAEGISMISTKQNEWSSLLRQKGIDALTLQLTDLAKKPVSKSATK